MQIYQQLIYAIVQGVTEFLPISSSGHLAILQNIFGEVDLSFDIFLHLATLLAILVYFNKEIGNIIGDFLAIRRRSQNFKLAIYLLIGTLPLVLLLPIRDQIEALFSNMIIIALGFITTGFFLFAAFLIQKNAKKLGNKKRIDVKTSLFTGIVQAIAAIPGISRSGSTISTSMIMGVKKEEALKFSFMLAIPAIAGASLLEVDKVTFSISLILPFLVCFLTGLASIYLFMKVIKERNFQYFAYYCWLLALLIILFRIF